MGALKGFLVALLVALPALSVELRLEDGSVVRGELMERNDSVVVVLTESLGELRIPARRVVGGLPESPDPEKASMTPRDRDPSGHALFFLPTAFTPHRGAFTFRDFELLFLTLGYSATDATSFTLGGLFPITSEFQLFTFGAKHRLWISENRDLAAALTASFTKPVSDASDGLDYLVNGNLVVSRRFSDERFTDAFGLHGALGYAGISYKDERFDYDCFCDRSKRRWEDNVSFGFGGEIRLTPNAKLMAEYLSAAPFNPEEDGIGVMTIGFRLHGTRLSADIAGFRPVGEDAGDLIFLPLLNVGYRF